MYQRYMVLAFLTNGLGAFGLRILAGAGLGHIEATQYLAMWYSAGLVLAALAFFRLYGRPERKDVVIGSVMAVCSLFGQMGMALALSGGIPGYVVFPVATGGGLLLVVLVGVLVFGEPMGPLGYVGIITGMSALVLLALPQ
jgi:multidrug transporter EmrE-like cation transporter